jgi:hypothetical protein
MIDVTDITKTATIGSKGPPPVKPRAVAATRPPGTMCR